MDRRTFIGRVGGAIVAGSGIASARQSKRYSNPNVTDPLIQQWEIEARETDQFNLQNRGIDFGDAYSTTLIYKDTRLTETLAERLGSNFEGIVGAFIPTRITFDSPVSTLAQPSLIAGLAERRFEETVRRRGFSELRERTPAERETTQAQVLTEYEGYYDIGHYTNAPTENVTKLPGIRRDEKARTVLYFDVSRSSQSLLLTTGIRPADELLRTVLNRDSDTYRQELLGLMHSVQ